MFRKQKGITQKEMCKYLSISDKTYSKIENTGLTTVKVLFEVAEFFGISPQYLLMGYDSLTKLPDMGNDKNKDKLQTVRIDVNLNFRGLK